MLSKWEKQDSIIGITCHEQSATRDHTWRNSLLFWVNLIMSNKKSYSVSEIEMNSNSHLAAYSYSNKGKEQPKKHQDLNQLAAKLCLQHWWKLWKSLQVFSISDHGVDLTEPLSSQNPAKDPRGTPEHSTSAPIRRRPWDLNLSSRISEALLHINPTCGVEAELGIQIPTETVLDWKYWKNKTAEGATCKSQKFFNHSQGLPYLFNPVHPLIQ